MADILDSTPNFIITSFTDRNPPVGVNFTKPAWQFVYVNAPVHDWEIRRDLEDRNIFKLRTLGGYPFTGVLDGKVVASINPEHEKGWKITYHKPQNGFTIALADEPHLGWTVEIGGEEDPKIVIAPITSTRSEPPQFLPKQLFLFKPVNSD